MIEPGNRLGDYEIRGHLGSGGMGDVYRAYDTRLGRDLAVKVLPRDVAQDPDRRARFEREARSVAALTHDNIVIIHTTGESDGNHYLAMELVEGTSLDAMIPENGLGVDDLFRLATPIASALAAAHAKGIIHRDLKPANVMVSTEGKVKVLDFGLAKLVHGGDDAPEPTSEDSMTAALSLQTRAGTIVGTMPYMSPEQLAGKAITPASDLFSLGVMLYEMATGQRPFKGATGPALMSSILTENPAPLGEVSPALPDRLGRLIERCLAKEPGDRPSGSDEVYAELLAQGEDSAAREASSAVNSRRAPGWPMWTAAIVVIAVIGAGAAWLAYGTQKANRARTVTLPEVQRLFDEGDADGAFRLLREVAQVIPDDPLLAQIEHGNMMPTTIETEPPGAEVFINSFVDLGRPWIKLGTTPVEPMLPVAEFRFRIEHPGYETVLASGLSYRKSVVVELHPEGSTPPGMVRIAKGSASLGDPRPVKLDAFWLDRFEVTNAQFNEFVDAGGYQTEEYWRLPVVVDGREVAWGESAKLFVDTTGRPGPSDWELGSYPAGAADHPVGGVSWFEASAYAAWAGKSLPTVFHWRRAAEQGILSDIITVSNFDGERTAPVGSYGGVGLFGTFDMAGNVREWCANSLGSARYVLGGAWSDPGYRYRDPDADDPLDRAQKNGFRCMKTDGPIEPETMVAVDAPVYDFAESEPVGDEIFEVLLSQFAYDQTALDARLESVDESSDHWRRERISFKAAYGDERVPANLYLPKNATPPYQTVVFFPSSAARHVDKSINPSLFIVDFIIRSGRALMYPIYDGTFERRVENWSPIATRDIIVRQSKDLRRAIDYLETRDDIDASKLAFCGLSWGASWGPIFTAVENRFKASLLLAGGIGRYSPDSPPESIPLNFMPRSTVPVLMVNGREDFLAPVETEIEPMFEFQGAPPEHKKLVVLEGGHVPDKPKDFVRAALDWLDLYLGRVE